MMITMYMRMTELTTTPLAPDIVATAQPCSTLNSQHDVFLLSSCNPSSPILSSPIKLLPINWPCPSIITKRFGQTPSFNNVPFLKSVNIIPRGFIIMTSLLLCHHYQLPGNNNPSRCSDVIFVHTFIHSLTTVSIKATLALDRDGILLQDVPSQASAVRVPISANQTGFTCDRYSRNIVEIS